MAIHSARGSYTKPSPPVVQINTFPAPVGGMDNRVPLSANDQNICTYTYNMIPSSYGMEIRSGYREWAKGLDLGAGSGVGTIIPFEDSTEGGANDRLFAVTNEGIFDVSTQGILPILKFTFPNVSVEAGYGSFAHYIDGNGAVFLFYADTVNGLYQYESSTDIWSVPTEITGVTVSLINFVVVHKQRIWFCEQNSDLAWYLPVASRKGIAFSFNFGAKFKHGGSLVGLYNWTVDGGAGVDDFLIGISSAGDVLPYSGSDPESTIAPLWSLVGTYFVGSMANGSRCASQYGGNVTLLSSYGIVQMSDLLRGVDPRMEDMDSIGAKVADFIRTDMKQYRNENGWDIKELPSEGLMLITTPQRVNGQYLQYAYKREVDGWGFWRDTPINCVDTWEDTVYFGTEDGRVCSMDVSKDNVTITPPTPPAQNGLDINYSILTSYQDFGSPAIFKRGKLIRPNFISRSDVAFNAKFLYDYDIQEITLGAVSPSAPDSEWDVSLWDVAIWGNSSLQVFDKVVGGNGLGRYVAVGVKGSGITGTRLASVDVFWDSGGGL